MWKSTDISKHALLKLIAILTNHFPFRDKYVLLKKKKKGVQWHHFSPLKVLSRLFQVAWNGAVMGRDLELQMLQVRGWQKVTKYLCWQFSPSCIWLTFLSSQFLLPCSEWSQLSEIVLRYRNLLRTRDVCGVYQTWKSKPDVFLTEPA